MVIHHHSSFTGVISTFPSRRINRMTSLRQHATTQMPVSVADRSSDRRLRHAMTSCFARYRLALYFLLGAGIAAGVILNWNWVAVARLLPILAFMPCMVMMFMCMKHGSRRPDPDQVAVSPAETLPSRPPTSPDSRFYRQNSESAPQKVRQHTQRVPCQPSEVNDGRNDCLE